jgi:hypothetical protein
MHGDEGVGYLDKSGIAGLTVRKPTQRFRRSRLVNRLSPK